MDKLDKYLEKLGFNVSQMLESIVKVNSDKEVLIDTIMSDIIDKIMMPLVETVTLVVLFVLFILALAIVVRMLDGIVKKIPVVKETEKLFYKNANNYRKVCAYMLANEYHPLVENKQVFSLLNSNTFSEDIPVSFQQCHYIYNETTKQLSIAE